MASQHASQRLTMGSRHVQGSSPIINFIFRRVPIQSLIQSMWNTTAASFGNNSQNYSQLALASQLILHDMVHEESNSILYCASAMK